MKLLYTMTILLIIGCGYQTGNTYQIKSVSLPVFENKTPWRMYEYELTTAVEKQLQASGIKIDKNSPYELYGEIVNISIPKQVEARRDVVIISSLSIKILLKLYDRANERVIFQEEKEEKATIAWGRGENIDTARMEVYDRLAKWVVSKFDIGW